MKSFEETFEDLKKEFLRIGSTNQGGYDLMKRKGYTDHETMRTK